MNTPLCAGDYASAADWLRHEFTQRKVRNPSYSLRAFAKYLKVPPGTLSEVFANKRKVTLKFGNHVATRLGLSQTEKTDFINLIKKARSNARVSSALVDATTEPRPYHQLPSDIFSLICDWYHYALLSLMETKGFKNEPKWIAARLGITVAEVQVALQRLHRLGLIQIERNRLIPTSGWSTSDDIPSEALRHYHRQGIEQANHAIDHVPATERDITSMVMAIDPKRLELAKTALKKVRRHIADLLECGERTEVYRLNIQLIPITKKETP